MRATDHSVAEPASLKEQGGGYMRSSDNRGRMDNKRLWGSLSRKHEFPPDLLKCTNACSILATLFFKCKKAKVSSN